MLIGLATTASEIVACFEAMGQLRTHLVESDFVAQVQAMMGEGYQLAFLKEGDQVVCVAGFRIHSNFSLGRHLYVEDLSTVDRRRSAGHGARMMSWLRNQARAEGCSAIDLDSGVQRHRAHRFYLNRDMHIAYYHFVEHLT